jgi:hypothetical protein
MYNRTSIKKLLSNLLLAFTTTFIVFKLQSLKKISDLENYFKCKNFELHINPFQSNFSANRILPQLLFVLGGKEVGRLLVIILQFKKKEKEKHEEYNLRSPLAKVRTT